MGNYLFPNKSDDTGMELYPTEPIASDRVGDVYLLSFSCGLESLEEAERKRAHYAVLLDVAGECADTTVKGCEIHFVVKFSTREVGLREIYHSRLRSSLLACHHVGRIDNLAALNPREWRNSLVNVIDSWFREFTSATGNQWNSSCNCQQFSRFLVSKLSLPWPASWTVVGDVVPVVIDVAITLVSSSE